MIDPALKLLSLFATLLVCLPNPSSAAASPEAEFHMARMVYGSDEGNRGWRPWWAIDYPWLFVQQVGHWSLNDAEIAALREYVARGGFLVVDDFHGSYDWARFSQTMARVFPGWPIVGISLEHPVMHVVYDLDQSTQIPGRRHLYRARNGEIGARLQGPAGWHGIYDQNGRLVVAINHNMDMGDAWEHADDPVYPIPMTSLAYRFAVNYVVYAMTH